MAIEDPNNRWFRDGHRYVCMDVARNLLVQFHLNGTMYNDGYGEISVKDAATHWDHADKVWADDLTDKARASKITYRVPPFPWINGEERDNVLVFLGYVEAGS